MPTKCLENSLPGVSHSGVEYIVRRPGWLMARSTKAWLGESREEVEVSEFLLVYRSPLVSPTSSLYAPVADLLLQGEVVQVVCATELDDPEMMHGVGKSVLYRIAKKGRSSPYTLQQIRGAICRQFLSYQNGDLAP